MLEIEFNTSKKVNGKGVDLENWPLLGNPWMYQVIDGNLTLQNNGEKRVYNFENWEVS